MATLTPWLPREASYAQLDLAARKRVACISRRHRVNLHGALTFEQWIDLLPDHIASQIYLQTVS